MKFLVEKYKVISIWLSLAILALAFFIGSDAQCRTVCVPLAFLLGAVMYAVGGIRHWEQRNITACLADAVLTVCMIIGICFSAFRLGGMV